MINTKIYPDHFLRGLCNTADLFSIFNIEPVAISGHPAKGDGLSIK
jgi:hypothetical protein